MLENNLFDSLPHFLMLAFRRHIMIFGGAIRSRKSVERGRYRGRRVLLKRLFNKDKRKPQRQNGKELTPGGKVQIKTSF